MNESTRLRVVFYQESGRWLAHCLETDLIGDGLTRDEALGQLRLATQVHFQFVADNAKLEGLNLTNLFTPADPRVERLYFEVGDEDRGCLVVEIDGNCNLGQG